MSEFSELRELNTQHFKIGPVKKLLARLVLGGTHDEGPPSTELLGNLRRRRNASYVIGSLLLATITAVGATNHRAIDIVHGLHDDGEMAVPDVTCDQPTELSPHTTEGIAFQDDPLSTNRELIPQSIEPLSPLPVADSVENRGEPINVNPHTEHGHSPPTDPTDYLANAEGVESSANLSLTGGIIDTLVGLRQYAEFFNKRIGEHTSSITGNRYEVYEFGNGPTPEVDFEALETIEDVLINYPIEDLDESHAIARECMRRILLEDETADRTIPIVIVNQPACTANRRVVFLHSEEDSEQCQQVGLAMPSADLNIFGFDVAVGDRFILLTTGDHDPQIGTVLTAHELFHIFVELVEIASNRRSYNMHGEERYVVYIVNFLLNDRDGAFADVNPFSTIGTQGNDD